MIEITAAKGLKWKDLNPKLLYRDIEMIECACGEHLWK
jgi:hypothetical protein